MLSVRHLTLLLILLFPFCTRGQAGSYNLYGTVKANDGQVFPYHVVFDVKGNTLTGYSVTTLESGADYNTQIEGHINRRNHTLTITELKPLLTKEQGDLILCLFDAKLTYKLLGKEYVVTGTFTGKDAANNACSEGTMEFKQLNAPGSVFYKKKKEQPVQEKPKPDNQPITDAAPTITITDGVEKQIDWRTDSCFLEVWEGGVSDGDVITLLYNDLPVLKNYPLTKTHKQIRLPIAKKTGTTTITVIAEKEGVNKSNTANILLVDGSIHYKLTAYNKAGKKASIMLTKR